MNTGFSAFFSRFFIVAGVFFCGCAPRAVTTYSDVDTPECRTMTEICKDAREFQREYERMPEEEKRDMVSVLNTYTEHCTQAVKACEESKKEIKE